MWLHFLVPLLIASTCNAAADKHKVFPRAQKPFCSTVKSIVTAAKQESAATAFCSSYLHIPESTRTSTSITTVTSTTNAGAQATTTSTSTSTVTITPTCAAPGGGSKMVRRDKKKQPQKKPGCLSKYTASAVLSSACSCLKIPPGTTTTTLVQTSTSTSSIGGGTSTVTSTTVTTVAGPVQTPTKFRVYGSAGSLADGKNLVIDSSNNFQGVFSSGVPGDSFQLSATNDIQAQSGGALGNQDDPATDNVDTVFFNAAANIALEGNLALTCDIRAVPVGNGYGCGLFCSSAGRTVNALDNSSGSLVWQIQEDDSNNNPTFTPMVQAAL